MRYFCLRGAFNEQYNFQQNSLDKVNSPEQLNDYIRVSNPGIFIVLVAVLVACRRCGVEDYMGTYDKRLSAAGVVRALPSLSAVSASTTATGLEKAPYFEEGFHEK